MYHCTDCIINVAFPDISNNNNNNNNVLKMKIFNSRSGSINWVSESRMKSIEPHFRSQSRALFPDSTRVAKH